MTRMLSGCYEYCDEPWGSIKEDEFLAACCCRIMKIALCHGTSMALLSHRSLQTSLNRNVIALNSFLYLVLLFFDDLRITAAQTIVTKYRNFC
jgi:hypothetical protein